MKAKTVKCSFVGVDEKEKNKFGLSKALVLISVGQESHENVRFEATVKLINSHFKSVDISMYDSLQRYTLALNSDRSPEFFYEKSNLAGDNWLKRNETYISSFSNLGEIYRWDHWIKHPNFTICKNKLIERLRVDDEYRSVFDITIDQYLTKHEHRFPDKKNIINDPRSRELCFEYLLEECVVLCMWGQLDYQYEIYPSQHNLAMVETKKIFITPGNFSSLNAVSLRFRGAGQMKPQSFNCRAFCEEEDAVYS